MGTYSECCVIFAIPINFIQEFKESFSNILILEDFNSGVLDFIHNFYLSSEKEIPSQFLEKYEDLENDFKKFVYYDDCIKFSYIQKELEQLLDYFDSMEIPIIYEAKELCAEYVNLNYDFYRNLGDENIHIVQTSITLSEVPEQMPTKFIDWLNN